MRDTLYHSPEEDAMERIEKAGCYSWTYPEYDADPCPEPSMRSGHARALIERTPAHARMLHPRLNPTYEPDRKTAFDLGIATHARLVGGPNSIRVVEADSWRTQAAKAERDEAYAAGQTPILSKELDRIEEMVIAAEQQIQDIDVIRDAFAPEGMAETSICYQDEDIWCRARPDWFRPASDDGPPKAVICDYKTTGNAHPAVWQRAAYSCGADIQAEMQRRAFRAVFEYEADFYWIVQETTPPYSLCVLTLEPAAWDLAAMKVNAACKAWRQALDSNKWPAYPAEVCYIGAPAWHEAQIVEEYGL